MPSTQHAIPYLLSKIHGQKCGQSGKEYTEMTLFQTDSIDWPVVESVDAWLDAMVGAAYIGEPMAQDWARISKVSEELGEAVQAYIGYTAQNPRKGVTHDMDDVLAELADVVLTGILAIQHFTKDTDKTRKIVRDKIGNLEIRIAQWTVEALGKDDE